MSRGASCMPFSGFSGEVLMTFMGILSIVICVLRYFWEHHRGEDRRPVRVYAYDMCKIAVSQTAAWAVNLWMTDRIFQTLINRGVEGAELDIEGIGWYAAVFLMDFVFGVPLGIWLGRMVNQQADFWWTSYLAERLNVRSPLPQRSVSVMTMESVDDDELYEIVNHAAEDSCVPSNEDLPMLPRWAEQNRIYGKYGRRHSGKYEDDMFVDAWGPKLDGWWWWSQTFSWSCCVGVSRVLSGTLIIVALVAHNTPTNPVVLTARTITNLPLSCASKQWLIAGLFRIVVDVFQYLIIDAVNKFRAKATHETLD